MIGIVQKVDIAASGSRQKTRGKNLAATALWPLFYLYDHCVAIDGLIRAIMFVSITGSLYAYSRR